MSAPALTPPTGVGAVPLPASQARVLWTSLRWVLGEVAGVVVFYLIYAWIRDANGDRVNPEVTQTAVRHGEAVLHLETLLRVNVEHGVQAQVLPHVTLTKLIGGYYGGGHFLVTAAVLIWLLARHPVAYRRWRSVLAVTTLGALAIFELYPTAPPRLLLPPHATVDSLATIGGLWSYNRGVLEHISDPYAAMPSLHLAWASWCALAVWAGTRSRWPRAAPLAALYPLLTLFAVLVTGTHFLLDAVAGTALLVACAAAVHVAPRIAAGVPLRAPAAALTHPAPSRRRRQAIVWGGAAAKTAVAVFAVLTLIPGVGR